LSHTLNVFIRDWYDAFPGDTRFTDTTIATATKSHGGEWPGEGFVFSSGDFAEHPACITSGTATVKKVSCTAESEEYCEMPEQITLSLSGMGRLFTWQSRNGGSPGMQGCPEGSPAAFPNEYETFCGLCGDPPEASLRQVGVAAGIAGYSGNLIQQDFTAVLDLQEYGRCFYTYSGAAPSAPTEGALSGQPGASVDCGGDLSVPVLVHISTIDASTSVSLSSPTKGEQPTQAQVEATISSGAVQSITITDPGSGYAAEIMVRVAPTITAECKSTNGTDAKLSVKLEETKDFNGAAAWTVGSVTVDNGGTGYLGTEPLTFSAAEGDTTVDSASGTIVTGREEPTLSASVSTGTGASLSVSLTKGVDYNNLDVWAVSGVTVEDGGSGYSDGESVTFTVDDGVQIYPASATTKVGREEPDIAVTVPFVVGEGAVLSAVLSQSGDSWYVSSVTVDDGGSGYSQYDGVNFAEDSLDVAESSAYGYVSEVDEDGKITAVEITSGGSYYKPTGVIESVVVGLYAGGEYYKSTGSIVSVILNSFYGSGGGIYYRLEGTGEVDADTPVVTISSYVGTGATATATVDTNLESLTFGQVTGVAVTNGGTGYLFAGKAWIVGIDTGGGLFHRQFWLSPPEPTQDNDPINCKNFQDRYSSAVGRTSTHPCPAELLGRSYPMAISIGAPFGYGGFPEGWDYCATPTPYFYGYFDVLTFFGMSGDITCTLAPA
jgi:hypothetical protein